MPFPKVHGLKLAANSYVQNFVVESLASDPTVSDKGKAWYNSTEKRWKCTIADVGGATVIRSFNTYEEFNTFVTNVASQVAGNGSALVGYSGHTGTNGKFSVAAGTTETSLDTIVQEIDTLQNDFDTLVSNAVTPLQNELDATQVGAGLEENGGYLADGTTNYLTTANSLKDADKKLDAQIKVNTDDIAAEESARIAADALKLDLVGGTMSGAINMGANNITNLATPVSDYDAATKIYVDTAVQGMDWKESVRVATSSVDGNLDLATGGLLTIDGVLTAEGDRVLVRNQTNGAENGIYIASSGAWVRSSDADGNPQAEVSSGIATYVEEGTKNGNNSFVLTTVDPVVLNTTVLTFTQFNGAGQIIAGAGIKKDGNELYLAFGAGVKESPSDEIGIDTYSAGGLFTTVDGSTSSIDTAAQLGIKLDTDSKLTLSVNGLRVDSTWISTLGNETNALQNELDATQVGAGLEENGGYLADGTTNYLTTANSLKDADKKLDAQIKVNTDAIAAEVAARIAADNALQVEVDAIEAGAGLENDGTYVANGSANYINTALSLKDADNKLDAQVKVNTDAIAAEVVARSAGDSALQNELNLTQTGAGLNGDGSYTADAGSNYITGALSLKAADSLLDAQIKSTNDSIASFKSDYNATIYTYEAATASTSYTLTHNLATEFVDVMVWVEDTTSGDWYNDIVAIAVTDGNSVTVDLTEAKKIRAVIKSAATIS